MALELHNINKVFKFSDKEIKIIGTHDNPWFCGKDIATILGYVNASKSIRTHVDIDDKMPLKSIPGWVQNGHTLNENDLKTIYVNESGLYSLIFRSDLDIAKKFKKWVTSEVLPNIRKYGHFQTQKLIESKTHELQNALAIERAKYNQLYSINIERLTLQKYANINDFVYIASSHTYARQGIFKIGRTKSLKSRLSGHNTSHIYGDKFKIIKSYKVFNATLIEKIIHTKLQEFRCDGNEFFMSPFNILNNLVHSIINDEEQTNKKINDAINSVVKLKAKDFNPIDWLTGITDADILNGSNEALKESEEVSDDPEEVSDPTIQEPIIIPVGFDAISQLSNVEKEELCKDLLTICIREQENIYCYDM
jgi:prophage antirepressor-like protein